MLKYIELKTGYNDNGPAWIAHVKTSKSGKTLYFNNMALNNFAGRGSRPGNYRDIESGKLYWISNVKKDGSDRHWAGSGKILVEASALKEYLQIRGLTELDKNQYKITHSIRECDLSKFHEILNQ